MDGLAIHEHPVEDTTTASTPMLASVIGNGLGNLSNFVEVQPFSPVAGIAVEPPLLLSSMPDMSNLSRSRRRTTKNQMSMTGPLSGQYHVVGLVDVEGGEVILTDLRPERPAFLDDCTAIDLEQVPIPLIPIFIPEVQNEDEVDGEDEDEDEEGDGAENSSGGAGLRKSLRRAQEQQRHVLDQCKSEAMPRIEAFVSDSRAGRVLYLYLASPETLTSRGKNSKAYFVSEQQVSASCRVCLSDSPLHTGARMEVVLVDGLSERAMLILLLGRTKVQTVGRDVWEGGLNFDQVSSSPAVDSPIAAISKGDSHRKHLPVSASVPALS
eukprot:747464-Hanusia_phi.AAC.2